jgi:hypothetical protein
MYALKKGITSSNLPQEGLPKKLSVGLVTNQRAHRLGLLPVSNGDFKQLKTIGFTVTDFNRQRHVL